MLKKLKVAATLITLLAVLFTGAMLITASPVRADHCSKEETKKCDKDKKEEKSCDKEKAESEEGESEEAAPEEAESESKDEDKGCDKAEE